MFRVRLAKLALVAGLALACGCSSMSSGRCGSFFGRLCGRTRATEVNVLPDACAEGIVMSDGPVLVDRGPVSMPSGGLPPGAMPSGGLPPGAVPVFPALPPGAGGMPMAPQPRLVPQPQSTQSQPMPYTPPGP